MERASDPANDEGRYALGAFLTLRLADRFRAGEDPGHPLALAYQTKATRDYLMNLDPQAPETGYLLEIVRIADAIQQGGTRDLLWAPLLAYAFWLEKRLNLTEALDVVETALGLADGTAPAQEIAGLLQHGRVLRLLGLFDLARRSYRAARKKAAAVGDTHSVLLSRIGDAIVIKQLGNLEGSARALREILLEAEAAGDRDAQARAHHDIGAVLVHADRTEEAIEHLYRAFGLYERPAHRLRALADLGEALRREGRLTAARDAFSVVLREGGTEELRISAMIALLEISAQIGDRLGFAKWRKELESVAQTLPPEREALFYLQVGLGYATFSQFRAARHALRTARSIAEQHGLSEYTRLAEEGLRDVHRNTSPARAVTETRAGTSDDKKFDEIARRLHTLRVAG